MRRVLLAFTWNRTRAWLKGNLESEPADERRDIIKSFLDQNANWRVSSSKHLFESAFKCFLFSYTISLTRAAGAAWSPLNVIIACGKFPLASLLQLLPQHFSLNRWSFQSDSGRKHLGPSVSIKVLCSKSITHHFLFILLYFHFCLKLGHTWKCYLFHEPSNTRLNTCCCWYAEPLLSTLLSTDTNVKLFGLSHFTDMNAFLAVNWPCVWQRALHIHCICLLAN